MTMFLLVTGLGSAVGVALGPILVDKYGGYADDKGKFTSLRILLSITRVVVAGAVAAVLALFCHYAFGTR